MDIGALIVQQGRHCMGVMTVAVTVARHAACLCKPSRACSSNYHNDFDERKHSNPHNQLAAWKPHVASTGLLVPCHATPKAFQIILYTKLLAVNWRSALCCLSKFTARSGLESTASANKAVRWGHVYPHSQPLTYPCEQAGLSLLDRLCLQRGTRAQHLPQCA